MSAALSAATETSIVFVVLIFVIVVRRTLGMLRGTRLSPTRLMVYAAVYLALFGITLAADAAFTPWEALALDAALVVVATILATRWVRDHVVLERRPPDQALYFRLPPWIPIAYVGLLALRLGVAFALLGPNAFNFGALPNTIAPGAVVVLAAVDALFALSSGLLLGRSLGVTIAYRRENARSTMATPRAGPLGDPPRP